MFTASQMNAVRLLVGGIALAVFAEGASASVITIVPEAPYTASTPNCKNGAKTFKDCVSTAIISEDDATITSTFLEGAYNGTAPTDQTFNTAFENWDKTQTTGVTWTIMNGGALDDLTLTVDPFEASATQTAGGIGDITVMLTMQKGYSGPPLGELVWAQAVYANFSPGGGGQANTLDVFSVTHGGSLRGCTALPAPPPNSDNVTVAIPGINPLLGQYCDPIYFYQFGNKRFVDAPTGSWPDASFRAIALLATVSETTNNAGQVTAATLTVYDGVSYGFDLSAAAVPEPSSLALALITPDFRSCSWPTVGARCPEGGGLERSPYSRRPAEEALAEITHPNGADRQ